MEKKEKLFRDFPPVSTKEWMDKINADLKGADFSRKMVWKTREGIEIMPFYRQEDLMKLEQRVSLPGEYPYIRGMKVADNEWLVRQDITVSDYAGANKKALDILMKGVTSLGFVISDPETINVGNLRLLLQDIRHESVELNFSSEGRARELLAALESVLWAEGADVGRFRGSIAADPLGRLLKKGKLCVTATEGLDYLANLINDAGSIPGIRVVNPSSETFDNSGTGTVKGLAFTLSLANEYLAQMAARDIDPEITADRMKFTFATGPDFFPEIARLRAARLLWSVIVSKYGIKHDHASPMLIHSVSGRWNKTLFDPHVNMLRTQTEAMAAVLGGAASITVDPYDTVFRTPDEFSERIARNQQLLLMEEAHLGQVADPGAGSYYLEELTSIIAGEAWKLFVTLEEEGGFLEAVRKGLIQEIVSNDAGARMKDIATRRETILGTNQYPDRGGKIPAGTDTKRLFTAAGEITDKEVDPLLPVRGAEEYEKLRMQTELSGKRPVVFLLTIGDPAMRRARAQFSGNFFACAGYSIIDNNGFETAGEGVLAAGKAGAGIIVICSSDEEYESLAPEVLRLAEGKALTVVAGNPPCMEELKAKGVEHFISVRSNVLETLKLFNGLLGIN